MVSASSFFQKVNRRASTESNQLLQVTASLRSRLPRPVGSVLALALALVDPQDPPLLSRIAPLRTPDRPKCPAPLLLHTSNTPLAPQAAPLSERAMSLLTLTWSRYLRI